MKREDNAANIARSPCTVVIHITAPYKLSFYYYYFLPSVDMFQREFKN